MEGVISGSNRGVRPLKKLWSLVFRGNATAASDGRVINHRVAAHRVSLCPCVTCTLVCARARLSVHVRPLRTSDVCQLVPEVKLEDKGGVKSEQLWFRRLPLEVRGGTVR